MTKRIQCQDFGNNNGSIKIKVIRAPLVDSRQLRRIIFSRARALVL
ncbi:MAG: hypothetical protein PHQ42_02285 [Patescibacteria group bacterium]|nr:hypothetical protein [Patescibacteria group bacterium]